MKEIKNRPGGETIGELLAGDSINGVFAEVETDRAEMEEIVVIYTTGEHIYYVMNDLQVSRLLYLLRQVEHEVLHRAQDE